MTGKITAYKAFNSDWTCRNFQFEVGKSYKQDGIIECCENGFHACENPIDTLNYYDVISIDGSLNKFAEVVLSGATDKKEGDTKIASAEIFIKAELALPDFIQKSVDWVLNAVKDVGDTASGDSSKLAASGYSSQLAASGNYSQLAASGDSSKLAASGDYSQLAASGDSSKLAASGDSSKLAASGNYSQLAASGDSSKLAASGNYSQLAASGNYSQLAASGDYSQLAASGDSSKLAASGDSSQLAASGDSSKLAASGKDSVMASTGPGSMHKGTEGTWIAIAEYDDSGKCIGFATGCIGEGGLQPDTWYIAKNGKLEAAE